MIDATELDQLARDLAAAPDEARRQARAVVAKGALNIKTDWRRRWAGLSNAPSLAAAVTYDTAAVGDQVTAEIGPDTTRRQGYLGNLLEYGSVNNAPRPGGSPALDAEAPRLERAAADLGVEVLPQ